MHNPFELEAKKIRKVKTGKNLSFDEAFLDLKNEDTETLDIERDHVNYRVLGGIIVLCVAVLAGRILFLQGIKGQEYRALAEGNKLRVQYILAPRGLLEDRYGKIMAQNTPSFELVVMTGDLPKDKIVFDASTDFVAKTIGKQPQELADQIAKMRPDSFQAQTLSQNIAKDQALILISKQEDLKGFAIQDNPVRDYKDPLAFSGLVGYTGKVTDSELAANSNANYILNDYIGKTGAENQFESYLKGIAGKKQAEIDAQGNFKRTLAEVPPTAGNNVKLNIDYDLQKVIFDSLTKVMSNLKSKRAAAVATNPKTGEVLALISMPGFDNNLFAQGISTDDFNKLLNDPNKPLINRPLSGTYPPGSTVKPMMATAALTEGIVTPQTKILDDGVIRIGSYTFYGYEHSGLGLMDVYSAISQSSDIYFYTVGGGNPKTNIKGLGPEKIAEWYRKFHLGTALGIDLPNEKSGLVPDPTWKEATRNEQWYLGDTYHESIGQGDLLATPLQVNSWTATIANGGKVMQPYVLDEVTGPDGRVLAQGKPKVLAENIFDPAYIKIVQDGMRGTVTVGSGRSLLNLPIEVSGKTGTAQFDAKDLTSTHAWFTSYAPSSDPQIALTVLVEAGGEGHSVAVPVAKDVYTWWANNRYNR